VKRCHQFAEPHRGRKMNNTMKASYLNSVEMANRYRSKALDVPGRRILVTQFSGTEQEDDLSVPANCNGYGRIRHFQRSRVAEWPDNPLPIDPARHYLQLVPADAIEAQVFQNAVCNWRCWYCFVPFRLLDANTKHSSLMGVCREGSRISCPNGLSGQ
jgi:hypothetical protein